MLLLLVVLLWPMVVLVLSGEAVQQLAATSVAVTSYYSFWELL
jgi:hypothetical protein